MGAKFTAGDSIATTRKVVAKNPPRSSYPTTRGKSPRGGNSIGMPGTIETGGNKGFGGAKGGPGRGPHREGDIGERKPSGARELARARMSPGMSTRNYRAETTGRPGRIEDPDRTGQNHRHTENRGGKGLRGDKGPPTSRGRIPGGGRAAGIGNTKEGGARAGTMESLRGRAKAFGERRGYRGAD